MGNAETKVQGQHIKYTGQANLNYFGKVKIYECLGRSRQIIAIQSQQSRELDILEHSSLKHKNLVNFLTYDSDYSELIGVQGQNVPFYFDLYKTSLAEIIQSRQHTNTRFEIKELERIIKDLLSVLVYYETHFSDQTHWNINPSNIFYDRENKSMKVYDNEVIQGKLACFYQHFKQQRIHGQNYKTESLCTPEIAQVLKNCYDLKHVYELDISENDRQNLQLNKHKIDLYLLGLVILECATYKSSADLLNKYSFTMNQYEIDLRIKNAGLKYGNGIQQFLNQALTSEIIKRPSPSQLYQQLPSMNISQSNQNQNQQQQQNQQPSRGMYTSSHSYQNLNQNQNQRTSVSPFSRNILVKRDTSPILVTSTSQVRMVAQASPQVSRLSQHQRTRTQMDVSPQRVYNRVSVSPINNNNIRNTYSRTPTRVSGNKILLPPTVNSQVLYTQYGNSTPNRQQIYNVQQQQPQQQQQLQQQPLQVNNNNNNNPQQSYDQQVYAKYFNQNQQQQQQLQQLQQQNPQNNQQFDQQKQMDNEIGRLEQLNDRVNQALMKSKDIRQQK